MSSKKIVVVAVLAAVAGCQTLQSEGDGPADSVMRVTHGTSFSHAGLLYEIGRDHFAQARYTLATESFEKALATDAKFLEARNALGIAWATRGNYEEAIVHLERAVREAPERADFHNNLGYAYHLQGRIQEALPRFRQAATLEPENVRFQGNLQTALMQSSGSPQVASNQTTGPVRVGEAPRAPARTATTALRWSPEGEKAALAAEATNRRASATVSRTEVPATSSPGPQASVVARIDPTPDPKLTEPIRPPSASGNEPTVVGFEISNGNGVAGMARRVAALLRSHGIQVNRLTNQPKFAQSTTQVQFRPGHEQDAIRMQSALSSPVTMVESDNMRKDVNVRLVIGRDSGRDATRIVSKPSRAVQSAQADDLIDQTGERVQ